MVVTRKHENSVYVTRIKYRNASMWDGKAQQLLIRLVVRHESLTY